MSPTVIFLIEIIIILSSLILINRVLEKYPEKHIFLPYILIFGILGYINLQSFFVTSSRSFGDTLDYLGRGLLVINDSHVCCQRPFIVPMVYKLLFGKTSLITVFQFMFSILSWTILAYSFSKTFKKPILKYFSFAFILVFSLSTSINQWQKALLSDSITFSAFALLIAFWIFYVRKPGLFNFICLCLVTIFWNFSRYTNNYTTWMITAILILYSVSTWKKISVMQIGLLLIYLSISIWGFVYSRNSQGWLASFGNVVIQRVLPDAEARDYFKNAGMPVYPAISIFEKNHVVSTDDWVFFRNPELQGFRDWLSKKGLSTYAFYLLSRPDRLIVDPWMERDALLSGWSPSNTYQPKGYATPLGPWINLADFPYSTSKLLVFLLSVIGFACYVSHRNKNIDNRLWIPILLIIFSIPVFFIVYHSDTNDIERHAIVSGVQFRLGLWMILLYLFDKKEKTFKPQDY